MLKKRKNGAETPYISMGVFKIRIPFIHYPFELPDYIQGLLMCSVDLAAIPLMVELLNMPFEVALAVIIINGLLYLIHHLLGDPVIPGWITPAIPLIMVYCAQFPEGVERVHALIAVQLILGVFSVFLGVTGLARTVVKLIPSAIKSGVIMGAGLAAVISVFSQGGRFDQSPWSITICIGVCFYIVFSQHFQNLKKRKNFFKFISKLGIIPAIVIALLVSPLLKEAPWPVIEWGFIKPDFITLFNEYTVFGLGLPPVSVFFTSIPMVLATYIVLFGDLLLAKAIVSEADHVRKDERIDFNPDRSHLLFGGRNMIMSVISPAVTMCGPLWAAMQVVIIERFKEGRKAMDSIFGGSGSFRWGTNTGLLLLPLVSLLKPVLGVAMAITLLIQGYVSVRIGIMQSKSQRDLGIAGIVGAILAIKGAAWGFGVGILLCLIIYGKNFFSGENDQTFTRDISENFD